MGKEVSSRVRYDTALYMCRLIRCAIEDITPPPIPENVNIQKIYSLAKHNSVEGLLYYAVSRIPNVDDKDFVKKWETVLNSIIFRTANFDAERDTILTEMKKRGLSYICLKGIRLSKLYPMPGMRSMADNDILFSYTDLNDYGKYSYSDNKSISEASDSLAEIMKGLGYDLHYSTEKDDVYHKAPFYNFEMHKKLARDGDTFTSYYEDPWNRAAVTENGELTFSPEDDFIYNIIHMYKHFTSAGCGIRHICDLYVIDKAIGNSLDYSYIENELRSIGLYDFYRNMTDFTRKIFSDKSDAKEYDEETMELLLFFLGCGTFGNMEGIIHNRMKNASEKSGGSEKKAKFYYIFKRIFPSRSDIRNNHHFIYKHPYLIPGLYLLRIGRGLFFKSRLIFDEFSKIIKKDK